MLAVLGGLILAASAQAASSWSASIDLSMAGQDAYEPQVAVDPNGNATAVWARSNGSNYVIQAATRDPGGAWGAPVDLSLPGRDAFLPEVAVDPSGNATAVWRRSNGTETIIQAASRPSGGAWEAPVDLSLTGQRANAPQVAVDSNGGATVVWHTEGTNDIIQAATRSPGGAWGAPVNLSLSGQEAGEPQVAVDPSGNATAVWSRSNGSNYIIQSATRAPGGEWQSPVDVSTAGQDSYEPQVAVDPNGNATAVWRVFDDDNDHNIDLVQAATRASGGGWQSPVDLSPAGEHVYEPQVAVDASGTATAVWRGVDGTYVIDAATRAAGGAWTAETEISATGENNKQPQVAAASNDDVTAVWSRYPGGGEDHFVQAATRKAGMAWGAPVDLSAGGQETAEPQVAIDPSGDPTAVWRRSNGANMIIQAAGHDAAVPPPVVNSSGDAAAKSGGAGGCDTGQKVTVNEKEVPECTLRAAIEAENAGSVSEKEVTFALPASAGSTITPAGALPALTAGGVTIKGAGITLAGKATDGVAGLTLSGGNEVVRGLRLANWQVAVLINSTAGADTVTATTIVGPGHTAGVRGVDVENSPNDVIGGTTAAAGNGITAVATGIYINGTAATGTAVEGNLIGTTSSGSSAQSETIDGVFVVDASGTTIGGVTSAPGTAPGNVIDADAGGLAGTGTGSAVTIAGGSATVSGATVAGNLVGLAPDGHTQAGLPSNGILVAGAVQGAMIGGAAAGAGNVIVGAEEADVDIDGTAVSGVKVLGNLIGTDATGTATVESSDKVGVEIHGASHTQIGSPGVGRNVITAAQVAGVLTTTATKKVTVVATGEVLPGTTATQDSAMGTTIGGNVIGPLANGKTLPAQIQKAGVALEGIGETLGPGDEISGNQIGVEAAGAHEQIVGEEIGTDSTGAVALPNVIGVGVPKGSTGTPAIGVPGARPNTISGNSATAVLLGAPASVQNNLIGTNTVGSAVPAPYPGTLPDPLQGNLQEAAVILSPNLTGATTIGGSAPGAGNVISGNPDGGIILNSPAKVQGNRIGVAAGSDTALPNKGKGIYTSVPATLGADPANPAAGANVIANETEGGILIGPNAEPTTMVSDSIYANASFGVAIAASGAPAQPVLTAHQNPDAGGTRVDVYAAEDEPAGTLFQIYGTTDCAAGAVQPHTLLATVTLDGPLAHGDAVTVVLDPQAAGTQLTATATTGGLEPKTSKSVECSVVPAVNSLGGTLPARPEAGAGGGTGSVLPAGEVGGGGGTVKTAGPKVVLPITASCSPAGSHSCTVITTARVAGATKGLARVELVRARPPARASSSVVGHGEQTLQPGAKAKLVLRLTAAGEKLLRSRRKLKLAITITLEQAGAPKVTRTVPVTLRYRASKHRHR
ncbi:MAG TPA: hypothetical protein VMF55_12520 [Solirubrobacterales bacterium]|nr:hypothetical protein [Solirubrobacterales bacterium]